VEVMGRDAGYIALHSGIGTGAEHILIPERRTNFDEMISSLTEQEKRKKLVNLVVVTEGDEYGGAEGVSRIVREKLPLADVRIAILGHIQRGGAPTSIDRYIASRMGFHSIECLLEGTYNVMVGIVNNKMHYTPLDKAVKAKQRISDEWLTICKVLAS
jgi:6-phosphofructokinase 1